MKTPTDYQIIRDAAGNPAFAVVPFADFQRRLHPVDAEGGIPAEVVDLSFDKGWTPLRAWREYLGLTQAEAAEKAGISQSAYSQHENSATLRKSTRAKLAAALGIYAEQLDF